MIAIFVATIALLAVVLAIGVEFHRSSLINARNEGRLEVLQTLHEYANPAVPTSIPVVEPTPVPQPIATTIVNQVKEKLGIAIKADGNLALEGKLFQTPVKCTDSFNQGSSWLICEPGVILDNTAAWTIPGTKEPWYINVPEGGFTFFSMGEGAIAIDGVSLDLPGEEGLNYLVVIRGRIDDTIVDRDLNLTAKVTDFVPGHAIWSIMPPGAYVSKDWFRDQLVVSTTTGGTNCGATGCTRTRIVLFDVDSHTYQMFETHRGDIDNWTLLAAN
jgi:hypothetical protein